MKQSVMGNTFAQWIVKGLLVLLGAGLAYATHKEHGPDMATGGCAGVCITMAASGSEIPHLPMARSLEYPPIRSKGGLSRVRNEREPLEDDTLLKAQEKETGEDL